MKGLQLDHLRSFSNVVELGSFSAAAERAGLTQPAVSQQIRQLERQLGLRLLERVGRRVQPTPAGVDLLAHARRIEEEAALALETLAAHRAGAAGRIRIGTGATACIYLLPPILRRVRARMPGLEITVQTGNTSDMLKLLENNAIDLALATLPAAGRAFQVEVVYDDELLAVRPASEADPGEPVSPAFLASRPLLLYESGGNSRRLIDRWFLRAGQTPKPAMELDSTEAIKELVGAGLGWAVLPRLAVPETEAQIRASRLSPPLSRELAVVLRRDKNLSRGLREFTASLKAVCAAAHRRQPSAGLEATKAEGDAG